MWRDIPGYEGFYQVSDEGRVRSLCRVSPEQIRSGVRIPNRILVPGKNKQGRLQVTLCQYGKTKRFQVHRLVLIAFRGFQEGADALHNDGDHTNNRIENLRWGAHTDNMRDKKIHSTELFGEKSHNAKLTADDVRAIRVSNETGRSLAERYGVSQVAIHFIQTRKTWKHID